MKFINNEKENQAMELLKSELVLDRDGIRTMIKVADSFEEAFEKGETFKTAYNSCYEANINGFDFMGNVIRKLINYWKYGEELKEYEIERTPIIAKFIGL